MGQKMSVSKTTATQEQLTFVLDQCNAVTGDETMTAAQFMQACDDLMTFADSRTMDMNTRHLMLDGEHAISTQQCPRSALIYQACL